MQVPYFQLLLSPALLQSCYLLFACSAAALIFFVLFRWFWICSCLVSLQNANSPDSLPGLTSGKISVILHCYFYPSLLALDLLYCILQKFCSADCCKGLVAGPPAIAG
jgi:hypothetical protein